MSHGPNAAALGRRRITAPLVLAVIVVAAITATQCGSSDLSSTAHDSPNIVVIMTDDQSVETQWVLEETNARFAASGMNFSESFVEYPVCCPSRATYLTGQYTQNSGVRANTGAEGGSARLDEINTLPVWLSDAGYSTSSIGKWLNGYGVGTPAHIPEGWDRWFGLVDPSTYRFWDYQVLDNGELVTFGESEELYQTDVLAARSVSEIEQLSQKDEPFFLSITPVAPHSARGKGVSLAWAPAPAPRHVGAFADVPLPDSPAINEADVTDKPAHIAGLPPLNESNMASLELVYQAQLESMLAVDDLVVAVWDALEAAGELDNTILIYTSDHGIAMGHHRYGPGKLLPYEPLIRVPLLIRGPGFGKGEIDVPTSNVDLAPTILAAAGAEPSVPLDGVPLQDLVDDDDYAERPLLLQKPDLGRPDVITPSYVGVRVPGWKYIEYVTNDIELYNLESDPHELENLAGDPAYADQQERLAVVLAELAKCAGDDCSTIRVAD